MCVGFLRCASDGGGGGESGGVQVGMLRWDARERGVIGRRH